MLNIIEAAAKVARSVRLQDPEEERIARGELATAQISAAITKAADAEIHLSKKQVKYLINQLKGTLDD